MNNNATSISKKERVFHSVLFEVLALFIMATFIHFFTNEDPLALTGFGVFMSFLAMAWNYVYNILFDKQFGSNRLSRGVKLRFLHSIGFEGGLMIVSVPLMMNILDKGFIDVMIISFAINTFFLTYSILYNWTYDNVKEKLITA